MFIISQSKCMLLTMAAWKVSKYRVFSGPYFHLFGLNTEISYKVFVFRKIWRALFSWNSCFEIHPSALLSTYLSLELSNNSVSLDLNQFQANVHFLYRQEIWEKQRCCKTWLFDTLTHLFSMHPFSTPWKHRPPDVFRG